MMPCCTNPSAAATLSRGEARVVAHPVVVLVSIVAVIISGEVGAP